MANALINNARYIHPEAAPFQAGYASSGSNKGLVILFRFLEYLFVFLLILSSMNVLTALAPASRQQSEVKLASGDVNTSAVFIEAGLYAFGGILVALRWQRVLRAARAVWPLLALAALACLSTAWSVQPIVTLRRSMWLFFGTIFAIYIGERFSIKAFAQLLARMFCLIITLIFVLYWVAPDYVIDWTYGGAWKGLSAYKNTFGEHMAFAVVLLALVKFRHWFWTRYVFFVLAGALVVLSRSATSLVCGILALTAIPMWRLMRAERRLLIYLIVVLMFVLGMYCALAFSDTLFQALGRDATLTGRTRLWTILLPVMSNRPLLGYGYAAFWDGWKPEVLSVWIQSERLVPVADNGYIDLWLSLGAIGVCLFLYVFFKTFRRAVEYTRLEPAFLGLWPVTYLCIFAADNVCESALLTRGTFPFLVFAILATSLALNRRRVLTVARTAATPPFAWETRSPAIASRDLAQTR